MLHVILVFWLSLIADGIKVTGCLQATMPGAGGAIHTVIHLGHHGVTEHVLTHLNGCRR